MTSFLVTSPRETKDKMYVTTPGKSPIFTYHRAIPLPGGSFLPKACLGLRDIEEQVPIAKKGQETVPEINGPRIYTSLHKEQHPPKMTCDMWEKRLLTL